MRSAPADASSGGSWARTKYTERELSSVRKRFALRGKRLTGEPGRYTSPLALTGSRRLLTGKRGPIQFFGKQPHTK